MASARPAEPFAEIDRLVSGTGRVPDEVAERAQALQAAARQRTSDVPLCSAIASALLEQPGERVSLFTGFVVPGAFPYGENDGPLGAVILARALRRAGFAVSIYADPPVLDHTVWLAAEVDAGVFVGAIPDSSALRFVDTVDMTIAIEKPGRNARGFLHAWNGSRIETGSIPIDEHFEQVTAAGKLSIAIGDRGNEIGFGTIYEELLALVPEAGRCACGCGGGRASVTPARLLYPTTVSNWGAYGLAAALAIATGDPSLAVRPDEEARLLHVAAVRGCRDGLLGTAAFGVDGVSGAISIAVVGALRDVVLTALDGA